MKRRVLRAAVALADEAERRIRAAGRVPPPHADVLAALMPAAGQAARAAREHDRAARWHAEAAQRAEAAGEAASSVVSALVEPWLAGSPAAPRTVELDPRAFTVELVRRGAGPAGEGS